MTPQQLRISILQLAIEGKLVEQREDIGNAESLYQQIQEEKNKLIKEGKIKREKVSTAFVSEDSLFDIPDNWKWCYLGELFSHVAGKALNAKNTKGKKCKYLTTSNVYWDYFDLTNLKEMYYTEDEIEKYSVKYGDLLVLEGGDVGRSAIWNLKERYCIQNHIHRLRPYIDTCVKYFYYVMMYFKYKGNILGKGIGIKGLSARALYCIKVPLPPLEEQYRIVDKIEELFLFVKQYEAAWIKLDELNKKFPETLKKSILHGAIQGKLVEQRDNEGTGEELYQVIKEWKKRLCESGEIKKEKEQPPIAVDEVPFAIPKTWTWVRLADIGDWRAGATPSRTNPNYYGGEIPWLKTGDLTDGDIREVSEYITDLALKETSVRLNPEGSVLMAMYGATIGKLGILTKPMTTNQACCACIVSPYLFNKYLFFFLMSNRKEFIKKGEGGAQPNISRTKIIETCMPLPPFKEQCRIVKKLEEIGLLINQYQKLFRKA